MNARESLRQYLTKEDGNKRILNMSENQQVFLQTILGQELFEKYINGELSEESSMTKAHKNLEEILEQLANLPDEELTIPFLRQLERFASERLDELDESEEEEEEEQKTFVSDRITNQSKKFKNNTFISDRLG